MKKYKIICLILAMVFVLNPTIHIAKAIEVEASRNSENQGTIGNYSFIGAEDEKIRWNILVDKEQEKGWFSLVRLDNEKYVYELEIDLSEVFQNNSKVTMDDIKQYCFNHKQLWKEIWIPSIAEEVQQVDDELEENFMGNYTTYSNDPNATKLEECLVDIYGDEYIGKFITSRPINNQPFYLKSALTHTAFEYRKFTILEAVSIVVFIAGVLKTIASPTLISVLSSITGGLTMLPSGESITLYRCESIFNRYATVSRFMGFPYGSTRKTIRYNGYHYSDTGNSQIDPASMVEIFSDSSQVFNSYDSIFQRAYDEYQELGYLEGTY